MSAARKGAQIEKEADKVTRETEPGLRTAAGDDNMATVSGGAVATPFPRKFESGNDQWERETRVKQALVTDPATAMTPFGQLEFSDRDAKALLNYEQSAQEAAFDSWFAQNFNKNDLATRRIAAQLNPSFYKVREKEMVDHAKQALRIKLLMLRGPADEEDLQLLFGLQTGLIRLGEDWDVIGAKGMKADVDSLRKNITSASRLFVPYANRQLPGTGLAEFNTQPFVNGANAPVPTSFDGMFAAARQPRAGTFWGMQGNPVTGMGGQLGLF